MSANIIINFYKIWHGSFNLRGAGILLNKMAHCIRGLQQYYLRLPEGHCIEVDFRDVSAIYWLNHLLGDEFEEKGLLLAIQKLIKDGDVVWDIGANSGLLSYQIAKSTKFKKLHMFEPNPAMIKLAKQAVTPFKNAIVHDFGISDRDDEFTLTIPDGHTTMGTLEPETTARRGSKCKIKCVAGDNLIKNFGLNPPSIIKIDTEGHELAVFSGLINTIRDYCPVIFFEDISVDAAMVLKLLPSHYTLHSIEDSTGHIVDYSSSDNSHNAVLIPQN